MLDLGPNARTLFCALLLVVEAALIATAGRRADRSYGFRMFADSSSVKVSLFRQIDGGALLPVEGEQWTAHDCAGGEHRYVWSDMVRWPAPARLDRTTMAPYGTDAALAETKGALAFIAAHTPEDCETRALVAELTLRRNGRETKARIEIPKPAPR